MRLIVLTVFSSQAQALSIEIGTVTIDRSISTGDFTNVPFNSSVFVDNSVVPLVFSIPTQRGNQPCDLRYEDIRSDSFDVTCVEPPNEDGPHLDMEVHYIAIEPGVHTIPLAGGGGSITIEAGSVLTTETIGACTGCTTGGSAAISFSSFSGTPILLHQIQSYENNQGGPQPPPVDPSTPWLTSVIESGSLSSSGANLILERSEVAAGTVPNAETIGWLATEATGCIQLDFSSFGGPASVDFEALLSANNIDGWENGCNPGEGVTFGAGCTSPEVVVASKQTRNGGDGGWIRQCNLSGTQVRFTIDEDRFNDNERRHGDEQAGVLSFGSAFTTPVMLAQFHAQSVAGGTRFEWTTGAELANAGFRILAKQDKHWRTLTLDMVPSQVTDSLVPTEYSFFVADSDATRFKLVDVDTRGRATAHGPFYLDQQYGATPEAQAVDWERFKTRHHQKKQTRLQRRQLRVANLLVVDAERQKQTADNRQQAMLQRRIERQHSGLPHPRGKAAHSAGGSKSVRRTKGSRASRQMNLAQLRVDIAGIHRVSYQSLLDQGVDLDGLQQNSIALVLGDQPQPIYVDTGGSRYFGPGSYIEFLGQPIKDSRYTKTNVYTLIAARNLARRVNTDNRSVTGASPTPWYIETEHFDHNLNYIVTSPSPDPWYERRMIATSSAVSEDFTLTLDHLVQNGPDASFSASLWGGSDLPVTPDHHVVATLNNHALADIAADGFDLIEFDVSFAANMLNDGDNTLTLELPADTGAVFDVVGVDRYSISYPRGFYARSDQLAFSASGRVFEVSGFSDPQAMVYRQNPDSGRLTRVTRIETESTVDGYRYRFNGSRRHEREYWVSSSSVLREPIIEPYPQHDELLAGPVDYLIISHPDFIDGLDQLVSLRQSQGHNVKVADLEQIYLQYRHGVIDPQAIREYIQQLDQLHGLEYLLLVGGDNRDYLNYGGSGAVSFIPSLYSKTGDFVFHAPLDPLYADVDDDGFPDLPIGRFPVRDGDELAYMVNKTLAYEQSPLRGSALFTADRKQPAASFTRLSDSLIRSLPDIWSADRAYLDISGLTGARASLLNSLNNGVGLISYAGHSATNSWTFDPLFTSSDAASLTNSEPVVVTQWGCWNTYHVIPEIGSLAEALLLSGEQGAAAVLGASTLTEVRSEKLLGPLVIERITQPGVTLGAGIQSAKQQLIETYPDFTDVILGWTLLGDPAIRLYPE